MANQNETTYYEITLTNPADRALLYEVAGEENIIETDGVSPDIAMEATKVIQKLELDYLKRQMDVALDDGNIIRFEEVCDEIRVFFERKGNIH